MPIAYTRPRPQFPRRPAHARRLPAAALAGLEDTGIPAVDAIVTDVGRKIDQLVMATKIGMVCSAIGALAGVLILLGGARR